MLPRRFPSYTKLYCFLFYVICYVILIYFNFNNSKPQIFANIISGLGKFIKINLKNHRYFKLGSQALF